MTHVIWSAKGLSLSAAEVYRELARSGAQRVCDLDRSLRLHRNTIAKRLRVMERVGLVQRSGRYWSVVPIGLDGLDALADDMGLGEWRASLRERNIRERHNWQSNGLGGRRSPEGVTPPRPEARGSRLLAMDPASITSALEQWRTERTEGSQPKAALVGGLGCSLGDYRRAHDPTMLHSPTRAAYMVRRRPAGALVDSDARTGNLAA